MSLSLLISILTSGGPAAQTALQNVATAARNTGAAMTVAGAAGLVISEGFAKAALEADALGAKMTALLNGANLSGAKEQVKGLADELAKAGQGDNDEIAKNIASALATGRVSALKQYGVVLSDTAKESIKAAEANGELAGQQELVNQVMLAGASAVKTLRANSSEAALSIFEMEHRMAELAEGIGVGSAAAKAALYEGVLSPILSILEASPSLQASAGAFLYIGSAAMTAGGSILTVASQIALTATAFPGIGASATAAFGVVKVAAASTIPFLTGVATTLAIPFAILAAGAAVGIAAYEALRAMNIGGFGDSHKSTAEIMADTRKTLMGDPAADAKAAVDSVMQSAPPMPAMPVVAPSSIVAPPDVLAAASSSGMSTQSASSNVVAAAPRVLDVPVSFKELRNAAGETVIRFIVPDVTIKDGLAQLGRSL